MLRRDRVHTYKKTDIIAGNPNTMCIYVWTFTCA